MQNAKETKQNLKRRVITGQPYWSFRVADHSSQLTKNNAEIVQRCQELEKAKAVVETKLQYEVPHVADLQRALELAKSDLLTRDKQLATNATQIGKFETQLQLENAKLERAGEHTHELEDTVRQLRADVQARVLQDEGLIARYQDDDLVSGGELSRKSAEVADQNLNSQRPLELSR